MKFGGRACDKLFPLVSARRLRRLILVFDCDVNTYSQEKEPMKNKGVLGMLLIIVISWPPGAIVCSQESEKVADEVFLIAREAELLAFSAVGNQWVSADLRTNERVLDSRYGGRVAVVLTNFRILAFSALTGAWIEEKLRVGEELVKIEATGHVGAIVTNLRAFGFSAEGGKWVVRRLEIEKGGNLR